MEVCKEEYSYIDFNEVGNFSAASRSPKHIALIANQHNYFWLDGFIPAPLANSLANCYYSLAHSQKIQTDL
jgi:hypothetical protein